MTVPIRRGLLLAALVTLIALATIAVGRARSAARGARASAAGAITIGPGAAGTPVDPGFVGVSFEQTALETYAGKNPDALNPVFVQLLRSLSPRDAVVRIGGDSTDWSWYGVPGSKHPQWVRYTLTPSWMAIAHALATAVSGRLILGVNFEADSAAIARAEADAMVKDIGTKEIDALELGNEPELYGSFNWYRTPAHVGVLGRPSGWDFSEYRQQFGTIAKTLPDVRLAGPSTGSLLWSQSLGSFLAANRKVAVATLHRYPTQRCVSTTHVSAAQLLSQSSSDGLADSVAPYVKTANGFGDPLRLDELNAVSCGGEQGLSNTFATSLWALDAMFALARVGVSGVNFHTTPNSVNQLFSFKQAGGQWAGQVSPLYYGLLMFAQAAPAGSRLLQVAGPRSEPLRVWAARTPTGQTHVVVINTGASGAAAVTLRIPGGSRSGFVERLTAPGLAATGGITLGGMSFGASTHTGTLAGTPRLTTVAAQGSTPTYSLSVPAASAAMLTLG
ncbi:MAG TPA: glycosyl hydrolase family 79 C-terminal domain-containing protein [Solirubrobacteraceae bacterium]|nr:glycosyl hydrolase family 79 C-terminal domain-containing protein [Solirubrobacteraceae bacterium]